MLPKDRNGPALERKPRRSASRRSRADRSSPTWAGSARALAGCRSLRLPCHPAVGPSPARRWNQEVPPMLVPWPGPKNRPRNSISTSKDPGVTGEEAGPLLVVPEAEHGVAHVLQLGLLLLISVGSVWVVVYRAVHVDSDPRVINEIWFRGAHDDSGPVRKAELAFVDQLQPGPF